MVFHAASITFLEGLVLLLEALIESAHQLFVFTPQDVLLKPLSRSPLLARLQLTKVFLRVVVFEGGDRLDTNLVAVTGLFLAPLGPSLIELSHHFVLNELL